MRLQLPLWNGAAATRIFAVSLCTALIGGMGRAQETAPATAPVKARPNVVMMIADDLNDWIGAMKGHPGVKTPHLDRLAARGTLFTNAHCQAPWCAPSRASFMTGLRPTTTGIYGLTGASLGDAVSLPQAFVRAGYDVRAAGKIFHTKPGSLQHREFPVVAKLTSPAYGRRPKTKLHATFGSPLTDWGVYPENPDEHIDAEIAAWGVNALKEPRNKPLFLALGFYRPHMPSYAPQLAFDLYPKAKVQLPTVPANDLDDVPPKGLQIARGGGFRGQDVQRAGVARDLVQAYLASISWMDMQVGRVLDAVEAGPDADNTVIVLLSDHGLHLGEKQHWAKSTLWERSTQVPLIVSAPGKRGGLRTGRTAELLDIYPTLVELCGLPANAKLEGHSLVPQLRDPNAPRLWPALTNLSGQHNAVRDERWRLIRYNDGTEELYDHDNDANEWKNLAADPRFKEVKSRLRAALPATTAPFAGGAGVGANDND